MDQVKIYLAILKKHHFWIVASLAALVGVICWWMGSGTLASQYTANKSTVEGKFKSIAGLTGELPNASFASGVNTLHDGIKDKVFEEWKKQYQQQQKLFKWPDEKFVRDIPTLQEGGKPLESSVRQMYKQLVFPKELERIFTIANVRRRELKNADAQDAPRQAAPLGAGQAGAAAQAEAAPEEPLEEDGLVVWDESHRNVLLARYDFVNKPGLDISEVNLRTAQQDMWLLEQMAKIIARTNEGATDEAALAVKRIAALDVAQWAVEESQRTIPTLRLPKPATPPASAAAAAAPAAPVGPEDGSAPAAPDAQEKADAELLEGRYLNDANQPAPADDTSFSEFKRVFVRMKLDVDQRKLSDLLVNCANSEIPLDVIRVQVDLPLLSKEKSAGPAVAQNRNESHQDIIAGPYDVPVEICGIMQIYNPPELDKLAQGSGDPTKRSLDMPTGKVKPPRPTSSRAATK